VDQAGAQRGGGEVRYRLPHRCALDVARKEQRKHQETEPGRILRIMGVEFEAPSQWLSRAGRINAAVNPAVDPISGQPELKHTPGLSVDDS